MKNYSILIVDDEPLIRESLYEILRMEGYQAHMAKSGEKAIKTLKEHEIDIVITDLKLPQMSGLDLLKVIKKECSSEVILITGYGSVESAVEAMKEGAFDYITKPINDNEIKIIINKIIEKRKLIKENQILKEIIEKQCPSSFCGMIGSSEKMQHVYHIIDSVANSNATILITGESGTGKGMAAKAIHESDQSRKNKPFVEISCGALSETLLESELFGHVKGAFTGAIKDKEGRFEYGNGGTIFLDEIDAFSPNLQVKLLRVLQDGVFERVGDNLTRKTNTRIIVATNQTLTDLVVQGEFREDLYYRINVIAVHMPPLRDRKEDIAAIVEYYLKKYSKVNNKEIINVAEDVMQMFKNYSWPGNIRELENAIEGAVIMTKTNTINKLDLPNLSKFEQPPTASLPPLPSGEVSLKKVVEEPEKAHIIEILNGCNWNRNKAAATLGVNRTTLYNKMKKYKILDQKTL